jgi:hypothetical protein
LAYTSLSYLSSGTFCKADVLFNRDNSRMH